MERCGGRGGTRSVKSIRKREPCTYKAQGKTYQRTAKEARTSVKVESDRSTDGTRAEGGDVCVVGFGRVVRSVDRLRDGSDWYFPSFRTEG